MIQNVAKSGRIVAARNATIRLDHLDRGGERLPLFMDEAFVNWDAERFARGLEVLRRVSEKRQIFLFSCHPGVVERLREHGAGVLKLDRAG